METHNAVLALGVQAKIVHCDLSDIPAVRSLFQSALDAMGGRIHILVNCAGIQRRSPCVDFLEKDWDDVRSPCLLPTHNGPRYSSALSVTPFGVPSRSSTSTSSPSGCSVRRLAGI